MKNSTSRFLLTVSLLCFLVSASYSGEGVQKYGNSEKMEELHAKKRFNGRHHESRYAHLKDTLVKLRTTHAEQGRDTYEIDKKLYVLEGVADDSENEYADRDALREILMKHLDDAEEIERILPRQNETVGSYNRRVIDNEEMNGKLFSILEKEAEMSGE